MNSFFNSLKSSNIVGEIPNYLQIILTSLGYSTIGSFRMLRDENKVRLLITKINDKLRSLFNEKGNSEMKDAVNADLALYYARLSLTFEIPEGHENLIFAIHEYCSNIREKSEYQIALSDVVSTKTKPEKDTSIFMNKFVKLAESYIQKKSISCAEIRKLQVIYEENEKKYSISCPYCISDLKVLVERERCIGTNFSLHLDTHVKAGQSSSKSMISLSQISTDTEMLTINSTNIDEDIDSNNKNETHREKGKKSKSNIDTNIITSESPPHKIIIQEKTIPNLETLPKFLKICIDNAVKNQVGKKNNRFDENIVKSSLYIFIRGGRSLYEFFIQNLNFPSIKTLQRHANTLQEKMNEGHLYFDELKLFLVTRDLPLCVSVSEDGTKIVEIVEYDSQNDLLIGLVSPFDDRTGMVKEKFFPATTATEIQRHIKNEKLASYIYVILARSIHPASPCFILGFYASDNKFTYTQVSHRYLYIQREMEKRNIDVINFSTDGDVRFMKAQKMLMNFGTINDYNSLTLLGEHFSKIISLQDPLHILNRMKCRPYDTSEVLKIGRRSATLGHLYIVLKSFPKNEHNLILSDLDPLDRLNYKCLDRICDDRVINSLKKIPMTEATQVYLKLMKAIMKSLVYPNTSTYERIWNYIYVVHFIRIWRQHLHNARIPMKFFLTQNVYDGIELNLIFLIKLILSRKLQYVNLISSQNNEEFFRKLRSYTGVESLIVNCSMKGFISRAHYMQLEEILMDQLKDELLFPKLMKRESRQTLIMDEVSHEKFKYLVDIGKKTAEDEANYLGIMCDINKLDCFVNQVSNNEQDELDIIDNHDDFLGVHDNSLPTNLDEEESSIHSTVTFIQDEKEILITKAKLCAQLQNDIKKVSIDIKERFVTKKSVVLKTNQMGNCIWKDNIVSRGNWIVSFFDSKFFLGRIINFQRTTEKTKSKKTYIHDFIDLNDDRSKNIFLLLEPLFVINQKQLKPASNLVQEYFSSASYICHVINDSIDISVILKDITKFHMDSVKN